MAHSWKTFAEDFIIGEENSAINELISGKYLAFQKKHVFYIAL